MDGQQNPVQQPEEPNWQFKPGETVSPRTHPVEASPQPQAIEPTPPQEQAPIITPSVQPPSSDQPVSPVTTMPTAAPQPLPAAPAGPTPVQEPMYTQTPPVEQADFTADETISWTASEYVAHNKSGGWHLALLGVALIVAVITWFFTRDIVSSLVIVTAGIVLSVYGGHKPRQLEYQLSNRGIMIGARHFDFGEFRGFSVSPEGAFSSITLIPTKRFAPPSSLYYDPGDEDRIIDILGAHLPMQETRNDMLDSLMRRIRF